MGITTANSQVMRECKSIDDSVNAGGDGKKGPSPNEDGLYTVQVYVPGDGYHSTELTADQIHAIATGETDVIDHTDDADPD